jgi:hypothetical protein
MKTHSRELVARVKGALRAGLRPKWLAAKTGIPIHTIKEWGVEQTRADVPADETVEQDIREALLGKFLGSASTR